MRRIASRGAGDVTTLPVPSSAHLTLEAKVTPRDSNTVVTWKLCEGEGHSLGELSFEVSHLRREIFPTLVEATHLLAEVLLTTAPVRNQTVDLGSLARARFLTEELVLERELAGADLYYALEVAALWKIQPTPSVVVAFSKTFWAQTLGAVAPGTWTRQVLPELRGETTLSFTAELVDLIHSQDETASVNSRKLFAQADPWTQAFSEVSWEYFRNHDEFVLLQTLFRVFGAKRFRRELRALPLKHLRTLAGIHWRTVAPDFALAHVATFSEAYSSVSPETLKAAPNHFNPSPAQAFEQVLLLQGATPSPKLLASYVSALPPRRKPLAPGGSAYAASQANEAHRPWSTVEFWSLWLLVEKLGPAKAARVYGEFLENARRLEPFVEYALALDTSGDFTPVDWWLALEGGAH